MTNVSCSEGYIAFFNQIETAARVQAGRLLPDPDYRGDSRQKAQKIYAAIDRLYAAMVRKTEADGLDSARLSPWNTSSLKIIRCHLNKIDTAEVDQMDLSTIDAMLDARFSEWKPEIEPSFEQGMEFEGRRAGYRRALSVRQALNIARYNFFNLCLYDGSWGPLWGKTEALKAMEAQLGVAQTK